MTQPFNIIILIYLVAPIIAATKTRYITSINIRKASNLTKPIIKTLKKSSLEDLLSAGIWLLTATMYLIGLLINLGMISLRPIGFILILTHAATAITLLSVKFNIPTKLRNNSDILKIPAGILAIAVTVFSSIIANGLIVESTSLDSGTFPAAQRALTTIGATIIYIYALITLIAAFYFFQSAKLAISMLSETSIARAIRLVFHIKQRPKINLANEIALMIGAAFLIFVPLTLQKTYATKQNLINSVNKLVIFSSFHGKSEMCGLQPNINVSLSILPSEKAAYAIIDPWGGYHFRIDECKPDKNKQKSKIDTSSLRKT
ncbi:hypothetical protein [Pseudomonas farris]